MSPLTRPPQAVMAPPRRAGQNHERNRTPGVGSLPTLLVAMLAATLVAPVSARDIVYCSNVNTGADSEPMFNQNYQTNGLCYDWCTAKSSPIYAFAIVQGSYCWCSNYAPAKENAVSDCNLSCPGFPDDKCGNIKKDLYGYMTAGNGPKPSGTKGAATTVTTKTKTTGSSTTTDPTTTDDTNPTESPTAPDHQTDTPSATSTPSATGNPSKSGGGFFSNAGRAAGVIVAILVVILLIVGGLLFYRRRRRMRGDALYDTGSPGSDGLVPGGGGLFGNRHRSLSMSTLGALGEKGTGASPVGLSGTTVATPLTGGATPQTGTIYDQRLDPSSLFMRFDHQTGSSRISVRSLRDDQDYSRRVLRLANPDD